MATNLGGHEDQEIPLLDVTVSNNLVVREDLARVDELLGRDERPIDLLDLHLEVRDRLRRVGLDLKLLLLKRLDRD